MSRADLDLLYRKPKYGKQNHKDKRVNHRQEMKDEPPGATLRKAATHKNVKRLGRTHASRQ